MTTSKHEALEALQAEATACTRCPLYQHATSAVLYRGNPRARVLLIGEAPGEGEDRLGKPFVGPAGRLLDRLGAEAGLVTDADFFLTNVVMHHPPANRKPRAGELAACRPYWERLIEIVRPAILVLCGGTALQAYFKKKLAITRERGKWYPGPGYDIIAMYHPAYLLHVRQHKPEAFDQLYGEVMTDLLAIKARLDAYWTGRNATA